VNRRTAVTVCVTGMHRSGTSFAARAVQLLGVSLGDSERLMGPGADNPAGYWENRSIKEFDDDLFAHLGGAWDQPPVLDSGWEHADSLDPFRSRARAILDAVFADDPAGTAVGWKDPRCSLLLPFWRTVTPITTTVVIVREPMEVAASLAKRKQPVGESQAALLWMRYLLAATSNDAGHLLIRQDDFFDDLEGTLRRIADHVVLPQPDARTEAAIRADLDPSLRHRAEPGEDAEASPLMALAREIWNRGDVDLGAVPSGVARAIASGWLRAPADSESLTRARARTVELQEKVREQRDKIVALKQSLQDARSSRQAEVP
jgi:hypothetical protein